MSNRLTGQPFPVLLRWITEELKQHQSIFGLHRSQLYVPPANPPYAIPELYGQYLGTPLGPAAGPHTQLAQNIVCAWLCGGRFIELKTVQIMDELEISRPCIDAADEGYNVEWSQELKLEQSASEYVKAWALIHLLPRILGWDEHLPLGTIFNMSVGYNLEGIQSQSITRFMERLRDASEELAQIRAILRSGFPKLADVEIPAQLTNNVTLSTMHGCPPDEVERIASYLLRECHLHTTVKLNPTLLGADEVRRILREDLGYREIQIPDPVFEHDMQYGRAVQLIRQLKSVADAEHLSFAIKLSNTLAMGNHRGILPGQEMYMSGRALYPITMNLFHRLAKDLGGDLRVSYSAGADAFNIVDILATGARPVTMATDLLKPGGYARLRQSIELLDTAMHQRQVSSLDELAKDSLANLERSAREALRQPRYKKNYHPYPLPRVKSPLAAFDCITAPCKEPCAVCQDIPEYARWIAEGDLDRALETILARNPLPGVTGHICTQLCQTRCTRNNYDQPVAIRDLKRVANERGVSAPTAGPDTGYRVAVVGGGPSGLAAAYFLALSGVHVTLFEARDRLGGMVCLAPAFRLPERILQADIQRICSLGIEVKLNHAITTVPEELLKQGFSAVYVACGFQRDAELDLPGKDATGVHTAMAFLEQVSRGEKPYLGKKTLVIGGGNTAMDAARTAQRLTGNPVTVVYRRTVHEMPATMEEREDLLAEGNSILELASPERVLAKQGRVSELRCIRNRLGQPQTDGRREPVAIPGSEFTLEADSIIIATGQQPDLAFLTGSTIAVNRGKRVRVDERTGQTDAPGVYAGGDVVRGPATIIQACADGRRAAEAICRQLRVPFAPTLASVHSPAPDPSRIKVARSRLALPIRPKALPVAARSSFALVQSTLSISDARSEAERCLQCSVLCDKCVEVCPNRANLAYTCSPIVTTLPLYECRHDRLSVVGEQVVRIEQTRQIVHLADLCNQCGNCATFCVHEGEPFRDKPALYLAASTFRSVDTDGYYIAREEAGLAITRRSGGRLARLIWKGDQLWYENEYVRATLHRLNLSIQQVQLKQSLAGTLTLADAIEMYVVLSGVSASLPFLPLGLA